MADRIKGQEVALVVVSAAGTEESVADVKSIDMQFDRETISEGYVGQSTEQKDDIFKGISGKAEFHLRDGGAFDLINRMNLRSKRRLPGELFQLIGTFSFPDGTSRRIVIPDARFGNIPISTASRDDYVMVTFEFVADDAQILPN